MTSIRNIFISLLISVIICLAAYINITDKNLCVTIFASAYAIISTIINTLSIKKLEKEFIDNKKIVHRDYALRRIRELRNAVTKTRKNKNSIIQSISIVEDILTEISGCCSVGEEKLAIREHKGFYGNFKTQIETNTNEIALNESYRKLTVYCQTSKELLEEM